MQHYFFIDTNIIIGYCNPSDRLNDISQNFFSELETLYNTKQKPPIFLLYSIQKEYRYKIQKMYDDLLIRIKPYISKGKNKQRSLAELKNYLNNPQTRNFDKYIIKLFKNNRIRTITIINLYRIMRDFYQTLIDNFNQLTKKWIKRPLVRIYSKILNDPTYNAIVSVLDPYLHYPDNEHVALACYEVNGRNSSRGLQNYNYRFFTDENIWVDNDLTLAINIPNFRIKKIEYEIKDALKYNHTTKSFNKRKLKLKYLPGNLLN